MHRALIVALACTALACKGADRDPEAMPLIIAKGLDGEYWSSDDNLGRVTLVNVWATWCGPCRNELPTLQKLHQNFGGPDFEIVGVSIDGDKDQDAVRSMTAKFGLGYRIVLDPQKRSAQEWKISSYPTSVLLDRKGHRAWQRRGEIRPEDEEVVGAIKAALAKP